MLLLIGLQRGKRSWLRGSYAHESFFFLAAAAVFSNPAYAKKDTMEEYKRAYEAKDWDGNGGLDQDEFASWGSSLGWNPLQTAESFTESDMDGDGFVTYQEFDDSSPTT